MVVSMMEPGRKGSSPCWWNLRNEMLEIAPRASILPRSIVVCTACNCLRREDGEQQGTGYQPTVSDVHLNKPPDKTYRRKRKIANRCEGARGRWSYFPFLLIKLAQHSAARTFGLGTVALLSPSGVGCDEGDPQPHVEPPAPPTMGKLGFCSSGFTVIAPDAHSSAQRPFGKRRSWRLCRHGNEWHVCDELSLSRWTSSFLWEIWQTIFMYLLCTNGGVAKGLAGLFVFYPDDFCAVCCVSTGHRSGFVGVAVRWPVFVASRSVVLSHDGGPPALVVNDTPKPTLLLNWGWFCLGVQVCTWDNAALKIRQLAGFPLHWKKKIRKIGIVCLLLSHSVVSPGGKKRDWRLCIAGELRAVGGGSGGWERTGQGEDRGKAGRLPSGRYICCAACRRASRKVLPEGCLGPKMLRFLQSVIWVSGSYRQKSYNPLELC